MVVMTFNRHRIEPKQSAVTKSPRHESQRLESRLQADEDVGAPRKPTYSSTPKPPHTFATGRAVSAE